MNLKHCLINLKELKGSELDSGYSLLGIQSLFNNKDMILELPFTRSQFIQELPEAYPHLAENEHATMMVMQRLEFNIPLSF